MKTIKTFLILIVLLIAGSISVYAGGAEEASDYLPGGAASWFNHTTKQNNEQGRKVAATI